MELSDAELLRTNVPGLELRGLLKLVVKSIDVFPHPPDVGGEHWLGPLLHVNIVMQLPNRDEFNQWIDIGFKQDYRPLPDHLDRGLTREQSVVAQALQWMWEHELEEGFVANGIELWQPHRLGVPLKLPSRR